MYFSVDSLAANDVPLALEKVADVTQKAGSIIYIGHSRGSTLIYMFAAENPQLSHKLLRGIITFAPIAYIDDWFIGPFAKVGSHICVKL